MRVDRVDAWQLHERFDGRERDPAAAGCVWDAPARDGVGTDELPQGLEVQCGRAGVPRGCFETVADVPVAGAGEVTRGRDAEDADGREEVQEEHAVHAVEAGGVREGGGPAGDWVGGGLQPAAAVPFDVERADMRGQFRAGRVYEGLDESLQGRLAVIPLQDRQAGGLVQQRLSDDGETAADEGYLGEVGSIERGEDIDERLEGEFVEGDHGGVSLVVGSGGSGEGG